MHLSVITLHPQSLTYDSQTTKTLYLPNLPQTSNPYKYHPTPLPPPPPTPNPPTLSQGAGRLLRGAAAAQRVEGSAAVVGAEVHQLHPTSAGRGSNKWEPLVWWLRKGNMAKNWETWGQIGKQWDNYGYPLFVAIQKRNTGTNVRVPFDWLKHSPPFARVWSGNYTVPVTDSLQESQRV